MWNINFFWRKKSHGSSQFFLVEKLCGTSIFTCDQLCVKKNDVLYDGIVVYFSWIFVF
jgi:hypothetical protein